LKSQIFTGSKEQNWTVAGLLLRSERTGAVGVKCSTEIILQALE